jgi:RNA polymerase sigma factor (sigma-70 family)
MRGVHNSDGRPARVVSRDVGSALATSPAASVAAARPEFATVAEEQLGAVYRYVHGLVRDADLAEDLTASAFEKALRAWPSYEPARSRPRTWLCAIARNVVLDHWRSERRRRDGHEAWAAAERALPRSQEPADGVHGGLAGALDGLSAVEREVIALRVLLDMSCEEAAKVMGITSTACSTYLHRVLAKLRREVAPDA